MTMHFMEKPPDFFDIVKFIIAPFPLFRNGFPAKNRLRRPVSPACQILPKIRIKFRRETAVSSMDKSVFFQVYCSQEQQILHFVMSAISNSDFC